jgi:hypothetical protein
VAALIILASLGRDAASAQHAREAPEHGVNIVNATRDPKDGRLVRYERFVGQALTKDDQDGTTMGQGPAILYLLEPANADGRPGSGKPQELCLTRVHFQGRMVAGKRGQKQLSTFHDHVEVYHVPTNDPDITLDAAKLPGDAFRLQCDVFRITSDSPAGKTGRFMLAEKNVSFRSQEYHRGPGPADL